ncbi:N-6 DNA methylase [Agrobacterium cavarae]|uniref:N-6 DNA methylase n=1 Tax=Agrobacterium cavarae TaxID=2528239 RepID=UPI003EE4DCDC
MADQIKPIVKLLEAARYQYDLYTVFGDWCECAALSLSNAVDLRHREKREARYMEIVKRYDRKTLDSFPVIMSELVQAFETGPGDILGQVFHALELHNTARGQFFTPYPICQMMAKMTVDPETVKRAVEERGFICAQEPAVGAGAMMIALAEAIRDQGFNYQQCLHVTAVDVDRRAVHMAYIQFTLMHIPAVVIEGDSLRMEFREEWATCAHIIGGWDRKLKSLQAKPADLATVTTPPNAAQPATPISTSFAADKLGQFSLF